jgi:hypothetical protein
MKHFTKHVILRMRERGISPGEVPMVVNGEVPVIVYPSPRESSVDLYFGQVGKKFLMIPVDRVEESIITVRPMHRAEKAIYLKEISHEEEP